MEGMPTALKHPATSILTTTAPSSSLSSTSDNDDDDLTSKIHALHQTLVHAPPDAVEDALTTAGIRPTHDLIHHVLRLSYDSPEAAVTFFRWSGKSLKHSVLSWNLIVDILGRNQRFDEMWDAVRAMKQEGIVNSSTFRVIFECYCAVKNFDDAIRSFKVMYRYDVDGDAECLNFLLSAICRTGGVEKADEFFESVKSNIVPDGETFRILLKGWEKVGDAEKAMSTFGNMVVKVGWSKRNVAAYDAFLGTLVGARRGNEAVEFLEVIKKHDCLLSAKFFLSAVESLVSQKDAKNSSALWDMMVESGVLPGFRLYNDMIGLLCESGDDENAIRLLDEMVFHGAFPDSFTYNVIFECLIEKKKVGAVENFFFEMIKNECPPTHSNCASAITMLFEGDNPDAAVQIWECLVEQDVISLDECANEFLIGLCNLGRVSDLNRFVDDMFDREIDIYESTLSTLKNVFYRDGRGEDYDSLLRKQKAC